jgi:hypothetical protein
MNLADVVLFAAPFVVALSVFSYCFDRFVSHEDTVFLAMVMREINTLEAPAPALKANAATA